MKYEELYSDFIKLFPEDLDFFKKQEMETGADTSDGMHVVFSLVIVPFIKKVVNEDSDKAQRAFDFLERMEKTEDPKIAEVLEFTILEKLLTEDKDMASKYENYFGAETLIAAKSVGKWFK